MPAQNTVSGHGVSQTAEAGTSSSTVARLSFSDRSMGLWLLFTGLIGALASFLLLYERILLWQDADHSTACDISPWVSCGQVMESWQASTFGFPNIFIGVVGFPLVVAIGVGLLGSVQHPRWYWGGLQVGVLFAFGFCVWLWSQAVYVLGTLCPYCMIVWAAVIPLTVVVTARNIIHGVLPSSKTLRHLAAGWWWVVMVLLYLLVVVSIVLEFPQAMSF